MAAVTGQIRDLSGKGRNTIQSVLPTSPAICRTSDGTLHVTWVEQVVATSNYVLMYSSSSDEGATWALPTPIRTGAGAADIFGGSTMAVDSNDKIHLIYHSSEVDGTYDIVYYYKASGGAWTGPSILRDGSVLGGNSYFASIAIDSSDIIWVAYAGNFPATYTIYAFYSDDGGTSWQADEQVNGAINTANPPCLAIDSSNVPHCSWYEVGTGGRYQPFYNNRSGGGWGAPVELDSDATANKYYAVITIDSTGDLWVSYYGTRAGDPAAQIYYVRYTLGAWGAPTLLSDDSANACQYCAIGYDDDAKVHFAWQQLNALNDVIGRSWNGAGLDGQSTLINGTSFANWRASMAKAIAPATAQPTVGFALVTGGIDSLELWYYGSDGLTWGGGASSGRRKFFSRARRRPGSVC